MPRPDCPACDARDTLQPVGAEVQRSQWHVCTCCATPVLIQLGTGTVLRVGKGDHPPRRGTYVGSGG